MPSILNFWNGHKTHILSALGTLASFAFAMSWIDVQLYLALGGLLGFTATTTLRHGVATAHADIANKVEQVATVARVAVRELADVKGVVADLPGARPQPPERTPERR